MKILSALFLIASLALTVPDLAQSDATPIPDCASALSYDLPEGWVANPLQCNEYGVLLRVASSGDALDSAALESGEAVIIVNVVERRAFTRPFRLTDDADPAEILSSVTAQAEAPFVAGEVVPTVLQDQPAARAYVRADALDMLMFAFDLGDNRVAMVALSTAPGETARWAATARAFAESLQYDEGYDCRIGMV